MVCSGRRILGMYIHALFLLTWAVCSLSVQQTHDEPGANVTHPGNHTSHNDTGDILPSAQQNHSMASPPQYSRDELYFILAEACWQNYTNQMSRVHSKDWCDWQQINRPYSYFRECLELYAERLNLPFPNDLADSYIRYGHHTYFSNCTLRSELADPPEHVLLTLILTPICLIPFLVTIVVCKSKTNKPQT
ncbi:receptor activity-modifying protein 2 [Discoglossus pictus]